MFSVYHTLNYYRFHPQEHLALTYEHDMIIKLTLILSLPLELRHLLESLKHTRYNPVIGLIDILSDLQCICTNELIFQLANVRREVLDERSDTSTFLAIEFRLLDGFDVLSHPTVKLAFQTVELFLEKIGEEGVATFFSISEESL